MKFLFTTLLIFLSINIYSQTGMTNDEYEYLTNGLKFQREKGLDQKKDGYYLSPLATNDFVKMDKYKFYAAAFIKKNPNNQQVKGIVLIMKDKNNIEYFYAIPFNCNECYTKYVNSINGTITEAKNELLRAISYYLVMQIQFDYSK